MKTETLTMPKLGLTMESGTITNILHRPGDFVKEGEAILEFETEKLSNEITAPFDGYVKEILVEVDADVEVSKPLCVFSDTE